MKVGIFTHPLGGNYGGILQAWALQTVLTNRGVDVETFNIDTSPFMTKDEFNASVKRCVLKLCGRYSGPIFAEAAKRRKNKKINRNLTHFIKGNIRLVNLHSIRQIPETVYDTIIVGSDQVWRSKYTKWICQSGHRTDAFLCDFKGMSDMVAYAASFGVDSWEYDVEETMKIKESLEKFKAISVRETSGVQLLSEHAGCDSVWVLDPTMLLMADDYRNLYRDKIEDINIGENKVVTYILDNSANKEDIITKAVEAGHGQRFDLNPTDGKSEKMSVENWLAAISNANIVITDSFHGCVFSIIFGKPLIFIMNEGRGNARFDTLIEKFGIEGNLVNELSKFDPDKEYTLPFDINERLASYRKLSDEFLDGSLREM